MACLEKRNLRDSARSISRCASIHARFHIASARSGHLNFRLRRAAFWQGGGKGPWGQRAALHCGGLALNAQTALRCAVLRPHRQTRCVRFALCAQTVAMSMMTNALRAGRKPCAPQRHRGAPHAVPTGLRRQAAGLRESGSKIPNTNDPASRQAQPGGGDFWSAEEHSPRVGARSALRHHSGRGCLNGENEVNAVSSAARPWGEHHRAVGAFSARPLQYEPPPGCACRDARQRRPAG